MLVDDRLRYYKATLDSWSGLDDPDLPIPTWVALKHAVVEESLIFDIKSLL